MRFQHIWPLRTAGVTATVLRALDDHEFALLRSAVTRREINLGRSGNAARAVARKLALKRRIKKRVHFSKTMLLAKPRANTLLDALVPNRTELWKHASKRRQRVIVNCRNFSFIDHPLDTYRTLADIARADCDAIDYRINFEDGNMLDVAPFMVLGKMFESMSPAVSGGKVAQGTRKVLEAVGLHNFMQMQLFGTADVQNVWPLPLIHRRRPGSTSTENTAIEPSTLERIADDLADRLDEWLEELSPPLELTDVGRGRMKSIATETLNNAERHGRVDGDGDWFVAGFMTKRTHAEAEGALHTCHLSFLNLGDPISATILGAPTETSDQVKRYCSRHQSSGRCSDTLATVFAVQDTISRFPQVPGEPTGGTGLMDVVEFANEIGRCSLSGLAPKVAIVSGNAYVRFDAPFSEGYGRPGDDRRLQWFNPANDVSQPPDKNFVKDLPGFFPGTLITMRFILDESVQMVEQGK